MNPETLAEALPKEQARCRELLQEYRKLGMAGVIGASMIESALRRADQAAASGDTAAMMQAYQDLKQCE